jgi:hypothetical protein
MEIDAESLIQPEKKYHFGFVRSIPTAVFNQLLLNASE